MASPNHSQGNGAQNGVEVAPVVVVMVPLPAQGHLNQILHLSRLLSSYNIPVHFVGTATHNRQAKARVHGWDPLADDNMNFHDFAIPPFDNPPPDPNATTKFPTQIVPSFHASMHLREPIYAFVNQLSTTAKRIVIIYDSLMPYVVQDLHTISNVESYCFHPISAFSLYSFYCEFKKPDIVDREVVEMLEQVPPFEGCFTPELLKFSDLQQEAKKFNSGDLYNANRVVEGLFLDLLARESTTGTDKLWAIGPFNPVPTLNIKNKTSLNWLDKQPKNSVLFVSFGSTSSLSNAEIEELAIGLEKSEKRFLWVLRDADKGDIFEGEQRRAPLPNGFEERVKDKGLIIRDWAPQLEILGHPSTGGFMTHCGWNSCSESISMGVPMAAWPMHSDQPRNAVLVTKVLKIGLDVRDWARREELVTSEMIEVAIRTLMDSAEGEEMRRKAVQLADDVKRSLMEGGVTRKEMDSFISHITRENVTSQM